MCPLNRVKFTFTIFDYFHLKLIRDQRKDLDARRQLISDYIASVEPDYDYVYLKETHIIKPNGDGKYKRTVKLKYSGNNATWYSVDFGATSPLSDLAGLGFHVEAYKYPIKIPLARITFPKSDRKIQTIIILDPPLSRSNNEIELVIEANWPEIWNDAVEFGRDNGRISLYKTVELLHLEFIPPKNKRIESFFLKDSLNEQAITSINSDGSVECIIQNPSRGVFSYEFKLVSV